MHVGLKMRFWQTWLELRIQRRLKRTQESVFMQKCLINFGHQTNKKTPRNPNDGNFGARVSNVNDGDDDDAGDGDGNAGNRPAAAALVPVILPRAHRRVNGTHAKRAADAAKEARKAAAAAASHVRCALACQSALEKLTILAQHRQDRLTAVLKMCEALNISL